MISRFTYSVLWYSVIKSFKMSRNIKYYTLTPEEYKKLKTFEITYGVTDSQFGPSIIGINEDRICFIAFCDGNEKKIIDVMKKDWPNSTLNEDNEIISQFAKKIFDDMNSELLHVLLKGTEMQVNVWKKLTEIQPGITQSYESIAQAIGKPTATRAVANAIGKNKVAYLIPCHRVINKSGNIGKYQWGVERKTDILKYEEANKIV